MYAVSFVFTTKRDYVITLFIVLFGLKVSTSESPQGETSEPKGSFFSRLSNVITKQTAVVFHQIASVVPTSICFNGYEELGCFSLVAPWLGDHDGVLQRSTAPDTPEEIATHFDLYTRHHRQPYTIPDRPYMTIRESGYDGRKTTYFITHGYWGDVSNPWMIETKDAILEKFDANVILVCWKRGASQVNYMVSASNIRVVGVQMARLGIFLMRKMGTNPSDFHAIGHSLGAHASAYFAKNFTFITGKLIGQITALDPAAPLFEDYDKAVRLDSSDATFVQVVHTSARPLSTGGLGLMKPHGDVDFYMNGGAFQPGCFVMPQITDTYWSIIKRIFADVFSADAITCDHSRALEYFIASLRHNACTFWGYKADSIHHISTDSRKPTL